MKKNKWCVFLQKVTGVGLAILFYCGAPIEPAAAAIVLNIVELDSVTAGAAYVVVSATGRATGADSVTTARTTTGAAETATISRGRSTESVNATGSSTARSRDGAVTTASDNQVLVQGYDSGDAEMRLVTNARAAGDSVSAWSDTRTEAENGTRKDVVCGVARSRSTGDSADASAQIFFLVTGEPTSTKSWTESKDLSNGTVVTTHENVVYVSEGGAVIIRTWITIRDVDKAGGSSAVATGKMVTVQNGHRNYART